MFSECVGDFVGMWCCGGGAVDVDNIIVLGVIYGVVSFVDECCLMVFWGYGVKVSGL